MQALTLSNFLAHALTHPMRTNTLQLSPHVGMQPRAQTLTITKARTNFAICCLWGACFVVCNVCASAQSKYPINTR